MSEEERQETIPQNAVTTTQEHAIADLQPGEWQMPEPVYRQTSGYLPKGFEKQFPQHEDTPTAPMPDKIEPSEPDIIAELASKPVPPPVEVENKRGPMVAAIVIGGLLLLAAAVIAIAFVAYYLFRSAPAESAF